MSSKPAAEAEDRTSSYNEHMARIGGETIPAYEPSLGDAELALLTDVDARNWLSEGKYVRKFESRLAALCERAHALAFCNAMSAAPAPKPD